MMNSTQKKNLVQAGALTALAILLTAGAAFAQGLEQDEPLYFTKEGEIPGANFYSPQGFESFLTTNYKKPAATDSTKIALEEMDIVVRVVHLRNAEAIEKSIYKNDGIVLSAEEKSDLEYRLYQFQGGQVNLEEFSKDKSKSWATLGYADVAKISTPSGNILERHALYAYLNGQKLKGHQIACDEYANLEACLWGESGYLKTAQFADSKPDASVTELLQVAGDEIQETGKSLARPEHVAPRGVINALQMRNGESIQLIDPLRFKNNATIKLSLIDPLEMRNSRKLIRHELKGLPGKTRLMTILRDMQENLPDEDIADILEAATAADTKGTSKGNTYMDGFINGYIRGRGIADKKFKAAMDALDREEQRKPIRNLLEEPAATSTEK